MKIADWMLDRLFAHQVEQRVQNAIQVIDDRWWKQIGGATTTHDRNWGEYQENLADSLSAWRDNPLARRIVALTTDYVVGDGIHITSQIAQVQKFIDALWQHPLNKLDQRLYAWCDELTRSGELFIVIATNPVDGVSYLRTISASAIDQIETDPDDLERELRFHEIRIGDLEGRWWPSPALAGMSEPCIVHYTINRPVGAIRGEGDLAPILPWLRRYKEWLEDRVRVNRLRNNFLWQVKLTNAAPGDLERKRQQYRQPPSPGSIIVSDENEEWTALSASLQSSDAEADGKALRLVIAAGAGVPLHFLSEGESATRATAAEMGGPTFRHYTHRQLAFVAMLYDLVTTCARRAAIVANVRLPDDLQLSATLPDLDRGDNLALAQAMGAAASALTIMRDNGWIDDPTAAELTLKFTGEIE